MSGFQHAAPEQTLAEGQYGAYRRHDLHKAAVHRKLISPKAPTPDKPTLIRMLENNITSEEMAKQPIEVTEDLDVAHLSPEQKAALLQKLKADDEPVDPFASVDDEALKAETREEVFQRLNAMGNVMQLRKAFAAQFPEADELPMTVKKAAIMELAKTLLRLEDA